MTPPAAPSDLSATLDDDGRVALQWVDNSDTEDGFFVEYSLPLRGWGRRSAAANATTAFFQWYPTTYRAVAYNEHGESAPSNEIRVMS